MLSSNSLLNKNFILLIISMALLSAAQSITAVALAFLVLTLTHSASKMSFTLALQYLPIVIVPFIGAFIDRVSLKTPLLISCIGRALLLLILIGLLRYITKNATVIYLSTLAIGLSSAFFMPAVQKLIPNLMPNENLARGNALITITTQTMNFLGFAAGGILVAWLGPILTLGVEALSYFMIFILFTLISIKTDILKTTDQFWKNFSKGIRFLTTNRSILITAGMFLVINCIAAPLSVLLPLHMQAMNKGAKGYGSFMAILLLGEIFGSALMSFLNQHIKSEKALRYAWGILAISFAGLIWNNHFLACLILAFFTGLGFAMLEIHINVLLQQAVPDHLKAQVLGTFTTLSSCGVPFVLLLLTPIIKVLSLPSIFLLLAIFSLLFALIKNYTFQFTQEDS